MFSLIFLVLQILLLSSFGLVTKYYQTSGRNMLAVGVINYAFAAFIAGLSVIYRGSLEFSTATCVVGVLAGICYFAAFFLMINTVRFSGISITWSAIRLAVLVPVLFSIIYWHERPSVYQMMGICLAGYGYSLRHRFGIVQPVCTIFHVACVSQIAGNSGFSHFWEEETEKWGR